MHVINLQGGHFGDVVIDGPICVKVEYLLEEVRWNDQSPVDYVCRELPNLTVDGTSSNMLPLLAPHILRSEVVMKQPPCRAAFVTRPLVCISCIPSGDGKYWFILTDKLTTILKYVLVVPPPAATEIGQLGSCLLPEWLQKFHEATMQLLQLYQLFQLDDTATPTYMAR